MRLLVIYSFISFIDNSNRPHWYASSEWWLVIIAGLTGLTIAYQAYEMRRATEEMRTTNSLQKLGLQQWLDLKNWSMGKSPIPTDNYLHIGFQLVNSTTAPLELTYMVNTVGGGRISKLSNIGLLSPGNPYIVSLPINLTAEQMTAFDERKLVLMVRCEVFFTDSLKEKWQQIFGRMVFCQPGGIWATDTENKLQRSN